MSFSDDLEFYTRRGDLERAYALVAAAAPEARRAALAVAAREGYVVLVESLLAAGTRGRHRALRAAVRAGRPNVVRALLPAATNKRRVDRLLWHAARRGRADIAALLLTASTDRAVYDAFRRAFRADKIDIVKFLAAVVDLSKSAYDTLLVDAADCAGAETVRFLLERGAAPAAFNNLALLRAAAAGRDATAALLRAAACDPAVSLTTAH